MSKTEPCDHCETLERETVGPLYPSGPFQLCARCRAEWLELNETASARAERLATDAEALRELLEDR